jgi:hypothetical protein
LISLPPHLMVIELPPSMVSSVVASTVMVLLYGVGAGGLLQLHGVVFRTGVAQRELASVFASIESIRGRHRGMTNGSVVAARLAEPCLRARRRRRVLRDRLADDVSSCCRRC